MPLVYNQSQSAVHRVHVCPGGDKNTIGSGELPSDWIYDDGVHDPVPNSFVVEFHYGVAEVPDHLFRYLIQSGIARASRLIIPDQDGLLTAGIIHP